jgi:hypothetical protein
MLHVIDSWTEPELRRGLTNRSSVFKGMRATSYLRCEPTSYSYKARGRVEGGAPARASFPLCAEQHQVHELNSGVKTVGLNSTLVVRLARSGGGVR